ncbi:Protein lines [Lucilia cuprina]|uniref:Protein lines n=1 Tax=Lucilia cuprina TaxID=7375 RepID=A0A0L0CM74_LUCCU|nr:Protein lines [Lucilia cuprina]KNC33380.1 Protein lines [Lucilia cuprina]
MSSSAEQNNRTQKDVLYGQTNGITPTNANNNNINISSNLVANNINNNNNNGHNTEQPQTKRQKIEKIKNQNCNSKAKLSPPPDILDTGENNKNLSSSCSSSTDSSPSSTPSSSRAASLTQLLNVQNLTHMLPITNGHHLHHLQQQQHLHNLHEADDLMSNSLVNYTSSSSASSSSASSSSSNSHDEVDRSTLPDLLALNKHSLNASNHKARLTFTQQHLDELTASQDMREFEESLNKQCLCGVSERMLRKPFQSHYSLDANGQKRVANLSEWPTNKLLQFLSNLQLMFDIYLKQNSKGFICARIMDVCDALIRNDHNLIDEIIVLAGYSNAYVQFLAGRVLASFLVIAKQEMDDDWLKKLVDNLFNFDRLDHKAVQKIHFSLEIIKRIVEWKDIDLHPLEEEIADTQNDSLPTTPSSATFQSNHHNVAAVDDSHLGYLHFQAQQPSLESNYFAVHYRSHESLAEGPSSSSSVTATTNQHHPSSHPHHHYNNLPNSAFHHPAHHLTTSHPHLIQQQGCHLITLTDSESFDTTHLKCITIKILENKWPALVKNMSSLIANHLTVENAENCILNFLQLWENIISVKANLSIVETLPFYAQLDKFELLLNQNLSCTVYKQMLCLFNEALCYGSTLALQDMLPDETCMLAHQIVRHVKDFRILESLPRRQPENIVGLIGFKRKPINYGLNTLQPQFSLNTENPLNSSDVIEMDKTILQKIVLLVLKSIAVTVKEIRSDSSDSSIDSTDYDAFQDMVLIERSIRDVLRKLESFIKHTLEFHPECHFSKILIHLFDDQDDHLIEAMVCTLDVTAGISFRNNAFPELVSMLNPVYTFLEFLKMISNSSDLLLDLLVSNETCFLLYLLRFLKYIRMNWSMFVQSCHDFGMGSSTLDEAMSVLIRLRLQISRLVSRQLYPYDISPVLRLLESCESLYEGNELS